MEYPKKHHVMEEWIKEGDVLSNRELSRKVSNEVHDQFSAEIRRRCGGVREIVKSYIDMYNIPKGMAQTMDKYMSEALCKHFEEGLDNGD